MISTLIVESDKISLDVLSNILSDNCPDVQIIASMTTISEAYIFISKLEPEMIFIDLELGYASIVDLLSKLNYKDFQVIFTTTDQQLSIADIAYKGAGLINKPYTAKSVVSSLENLLS